MDTTEAGAAKPHITDMDEARQGSVARFLSDSLQIALLRGGITKNYRDLRLAFLEKRWREASTDYHMRLLAILLTQFDAYQGSSLERIHMALHILDAHFEHPAWHLSTLDPRRGHEIDQLLPAL